MGIDDAGHDIMVKMIENITFCEYYNNLYTCVCVCFQIIIAYLKSSIIKICYSYEEYSQ